MTEVVRNAIIDGQGNDLLVSVQPTVSDPSKNAMMVSIPDGVDLNVGDIEIGAVELKNGSDDTRAIISPANTARSASNPVLLVQNIDASGNVGGGASDTDDASFSVGTDKGQVIMGVYTTDTVDVGDKGALAMTADRKLLVQTSGTTTSSGSLTNAEFQSPYDFTATYTSNVTITCSGAPFTIDDTVCTITDLWYKHVGGNRTALTNTGGGVSISATNNVITVTGAGTPFASGDIYKVGVDYQRKGYSKAVSANKVNEISPVNSFSTPNTPLISGTQTLTGSFLPVGTEIPMSGLSGGCFYLTYVANNSLGLRLQLICRSAIGSASLYVMPIRQRDMLNSSDSTDGTYKQANSNSNNTYIVPFSVGNNVASVQLYASVATVGTPTAGTIAGTVSTSRGGQTTFPQNLQLEDGAVTSRNYLQAIAEGDVSGHSTRAKNGYNADIGNAFEDLWAVGGNYVRPTVAQQMEVVSSSANDTSAGTGARTIRIYYLDGNLAQKTTDVTLNGLTPVATSVSDIYRVNNMVVTSVGTGGVSAGNIDIRNWADTPIYGRIPAGYNEDRDYIYTVPAGKSLYITNVLLGCGSGTAGRAVQFSTQATYDKLGGALRTFFIDYTTILLQDNSIDLLLEMPTSFPAGTDLKMRAISPDGATYCSCTVRGWIE